MEGPLLVAAVEDGHSSEAGIAVQAQAVLDYLIALLKITLGASDVDLHDSLLSKSNRSETSYCCSRFAQKAQVALYVQKEVVSTAVTNGNSVEHSEPTPSFCYTLSPELSTSPNNVCTLGILKHPQALDSSLPISSQVQIINLPGPASTTHSHSNDVPSTSPFAVLHSFVHLALAPFFDNLTRSKDVLDHYLPREGDAKGGIPSARKKIADLELSLLHLQQSVEIPRLTLYYHPVVREALEIAAERRVKPTIDLVPGSRLSDSMFLNNLQSVVNGWIKDIKTITETSRDPSSGTAMQEINFWLAMEDTVEAIETQLSSEGVHLTMDILRHAKRFHTAFSFTADTGLREKAETVQKYNQLMRDFPLHELISATSLQRVRDSLNSIFNHLNKRFRPSSYPIRRALPFVEGVSADLDAQFRALLPGRSLMLLDFDEFEALMEIAEEVWQAWDENVKEFTSIAREVTRRRNEKFIPIKISARHDGTQDRLKYVRTFRINHEQLQRTIVTVLGSKQDGVDRREGGADLSAVIVEEMGDVDAAQEVSQAYKVLEDVDVLDISPEGTRRWSQAEMTYNERTARVENTIIARLRDRLAVTKTANEMFRVFSKFNALFVRPKIRGAVSEYQGQLIESVKEDTAALQERFKQQYGRSEAHAMAQLRDIPAVSGTVTWIRQIERQLDGYMKRVEDILGQGWIYHVEGQKLQSESLMFRQKLETRPIYDAWLQDVTRRNLSISGRLFDISRNRSTGNLLQLSVNFEMQIITLFKEVRNLTWLNFAIPHAINKTSKDARRAYPYAVSLMESVHTYTHAFTDIEGMSDISMLLNGYRHESQSMIVKGVPLLWESLINSYDLHVRQTTQSTDTSTARGETKHVQFIRDFAVAVNSLQEKASCLLVINETVEKALRDLQTCAYSEISFRSSLDAVQEIVDRLNLQSFVNLPYWVGALNARIEVILLGRLRQAMLVWVDAFNGFTDETKASASLERQQLGQYGVTSSAEIMPQFEVLDHEILMRNQVLFVEPPICFTRARWLAQFHDWIGIVCNLRRLVASRFEMNPILRGQLDDSTHFWDLLQQSTETLAWVNGVVETKLEVIADYIITWVELQSLWDLRSEQLFDTLQDDLPRWIELLQDIRRRRSTFDNSRVSQPFGNVVVYYEQVQLKVNAKYDQWQQEILMRFGEKLGIRVAEAFSDMEEIRKNLEGQSLDASSTATAVLFITSVQRCKRKVAHWSPEMELFRHGETSLVRYRYQFPVEWISVECVEHEWTALVDILERKTKIIDDQTEALCAKIKAQDRIVAQRITDVSNQWADQKPISGETDPNKAARILTFFESKFTQLRTEAEDISKAKEALDLPTISNTSLPKVIEEVQDFKSVWAGLSTIWGGIDDLRDTLWTSVQPRKLRQALEDLIKLTKDMPSRMRQYAAFEHVLKVLRHFLQMNPLLAELRSDVVRERHWEKIFKLLHPSQRYSPSSTTLKDVWDLKLSSSEAVIRDIIAQARGEMALEEFLKQVRDTWQNYSLDLVNYQNKCRLIRGWDELFAKSSENINSLQAMRHSPYYKEFAEESSAWEEKLNRVHILFDIWIDVQRQWVYLEGVFAGNADIKHLLPLETSRFQTINTEFMTVMKKVYKSSLVLDVVGIPHLQKSLEWLTQLLSKVQKALGEYLERERSAFPRFYFVGDEDLLEIIGNNSDTSMIAKHLGKMFAAIHGLIVEDASTIIGISSKQGEEVRFTKPISLARIPKVNDWLGALEVNMKLSLAELLSAAVQDFEILFLELTTDGNAFREFISSYPAQVVVLATQVSWTNKVEEALDEGGKALSTLHQSLVLLLQLLADAILQDLDAAHRKKCEHLITECVHQRDIVDKLISTNARSRSHFLWLLQMRYVFKPDEDPLKRLKIQMANASFDYGFEYLGVPERLVRTPLTDRCFLTLTQALSQRLGGSPYGPAGTGKTETVKALAVQLGRHNLVFCCDDSFDFKAMGRIFLGICQVGAWGCFDEFNRLEERILSAVSQQIQNIQVALRSSTMEQKALIDLLGRQIQVNASMGIFITMNPGYAGRSNLPDNLKKLFRSIAMSNPDRELIAEALLYSQGFSEAKRLSRQVVPFFDLCLARISKQAHYDFGLRALKSVLVNSGAIKRARISDAVGQPRASEKQILLQSVRQTVTPKLLPADVATMLAIEKEAFPGTEYVPVAYNELQQGICDVASAHSLAVTEHYLTKVLQLYQIQLLHHGLMVVGKSGSGKTSVWRLLLEALQKVEGIEGVSYVVDAKVMSKESLYGALDPTTREWSDGLFTAILRKIVVNLRGEDSKRHWIVFDGDVDPEWVEYLNSVLDDNKLLTLPNGERLALPPNVRIIFEVQDLKYATPATVSRCGMVWFDDAIVSVQMLFKKYLDRLRTDAFEELEDGLTAMDEGPTIVMAIQRQCADLLQHHLLQNELLLSALERARSLSHVMEYTDIRAMNTLFSLLNQACRTMIRYQTEHTEFLLDPVCAEQYLSRKMLLSLVWSLTGDCPLSDRKAFGNFVANYLNEEIPSLAASASLIDFDTSLPTAKWVSWLTQVPSVEVNTHSIAQTDVVIPTLDTVRHEALFCSLLAERRPVLLCGPPGSGKTMTLFNALRNMPDMEIVGLNFSSATTPELVIKTFEQYCEYQRTLNGTTLSPKQVGRWLVIFCDEINLPAPDKYGTQRVISFLRQLIEQKGFWRTTDRNWIKLERIQFIGACNPPTDVGRNRLGLRFLRHAPVIMVDYPGELSLLQIYGTFNSAVLKIIPPLRGQAEALTRAMVQLYNESQQRFTSQIQTHYIYSPRELTRWSRGFYEAIRHLDALTLEGMVRIWAHEAFRLFQDRLVTVDERRWTDMAVRRIALQHFPTINEDEALAGPILFSNWLSKHYIPVKREVLRDFVKARLRTFCEEEVDVPLVLFNDVLDHVLRIDRVFRQPQGHLILIGVSGSGKTTLSRFVAWMNGLSVFQIRVHGKYLAEDFDEDLRTVLRRCGCKGEKICFILDESNVLDFAFLERMNTLLANAEVPGLFEGDELASLMTACKESAQRQGVLLDSQEELYRWFTQQIVKNLHVVFTMNPPEEGLSSRVATSPALFNRCVLNWFGDWSDEALYHVGSELTQSVDLAQQHYSAPESLQPAYSGLNLPPSYREAVIDAMVFIHKSLSMINLGLLRRGKRTTIITPRHFLDFVAQFIRLLNRKRGDLEEQQRHINIGLDKLRDTVDKVSHLRKSLADKSSQLKRKDAEANEKLQRMIADQGEAEQRKTTSLEIQVALEKQKREIASRKDIVMNDLARAEPAVVEAQRSVSNIKRQHLTEVRSMGSPPAGVKLALESVCTLLGHRVNDWKAIQAIVRRDDFIASIINFDNERQMTRGHRLKMRNEFLSNEDFTYERVNRASKACGPLVQWVEAQVNYSEILDSVGPLREEVYELEDQALQTRAEAQAIDDTISSLEASILTYKAEYATLISETQAIRTEMSRVESKVNRSLRLLDSLSSERSRWESSSRTFEHQLETLVGDVLVASSSLVYSGFYDQQARQSMLQQWCQHLSNSGIKYNPHNRITEYLSTPDERLEWQKNSLPVDELFTENAIILKEFNRYPLIIDPSGRVAEFLQHQVKDRRLIVTSFLDDSFVKQLESSLRFGNAILIEDAEHYDPILNHVLNKEYQKTGGRVLIRLGKQEIDFSPSFKLFLCTRNPSVDFAPDLCSRTTLVNFTVTQSSLHMQSLNAILKSERPDVDERRINLVKMQGEFRTHLRQLERELLRALNESRGNILDDDKVIETLETLKKEAADIAVKVSQTDGVIAEVDQIMSRYGIIAKCCVSIFSTLERLCQINHFYRFSLEYFTNIFNSVLNAAKQSLRDEDVSARVDYILRALFYDTYRRASLTLVQKDRITLAMLLIRASPYDMDRSIIDDILDTSFTSGTDISTDASQWDEAKSFAIEHSRLGTELEAAKESSWEERLQEDDMERGLLDIWSSDVEKFDRHLLSLLLIKLFRVDRLVPAVERFVTAVFREDFLQINDDLNEVVQQVSSSSPIALTCSPGFDASYKVDRLVESTGKHCTNIAMGSEEAIAMAEKAISSAAAAGSWVLVKNVQLAPSWVDSLEKRIASLKPHSGFRLFISMETSPKIPVNLLRASRVLMCEQPAGIKANMKDSLSALSSRSAKPPVERARVFLLLAYLHAVIQERLRYAPNLGWKGLWEFNDSDYDCCAFVIDAWIDAVSGDRSNIAPKNIPWELLWELVTVTYGGKVDNEHDYEQLRGFVQSILTPAAYDYEYNIIQNLGNKEHIVNGGKLELLLPAGTGWKDLIAWVDSLPEREPPTYLGLPANAEKLLLIGQAKEMLDNVRLITQSLDGEEQVDMEISRAML